MRITVLENRRVKKQSSGFKVPKDHRIGFLYKYTVPLFTVGHVALAIYQLYERHIILASDTGIILTESRSGMNDTGTVCHGYVVIDYDVMCFLVLLVGSLCGSFEKGLVLHSLEVLSDVLFKNLVSGCVFPGELSEKGIGKSLRKDIGISVGCLDLHIALGRIDTECDVGRKGPGCGRPCKEVEIPVLSLETYDSRALLYGLVALSNLV
jgi:hypothetical protein